MHDTNQHLKDRCLKIQQLAPYALKVTSFLFFSLKQLFHVAKYSDEWYNLIAIIIIIVIEVFKLAFIHWCPDHYHVLFFQVTTKPWTFCLYWGSECFEEVPWSTAVILWGRSTFCYTCKTKGMNLMLSNICVIHFFQMFGSVAILLGIW